MKDILLLGYAREKSTRCKNKMTRPFGDTTLFDIYLNKFEVMYDIRDKLPFSDMTMAIGKSDKILWDSIMKSDIPYSQRTRESIKSSIKDDCKKVYHYLEDFDEEYVMWVNGCFPFLKISTIINAADWFKNNTKCEGLHCVKRVQNWFWENNRPIRPISSVSTVHANSLYESVHCFHIYKKEHLLNNNMYWSFTKGDPYLYGVPDDVEYMDIDTEFEFDLCERIYKQTCGCC